MSHISVRWARISPIHTRGVGHSFVEIESVMKREGCGIYHRQSVPLQLGQRFPWGNPSYQVPVPPHMAHSPAPRLAEAMSSHEDDLGVEVSHLKNFESQPVVTTGASMGSECYSTPATSCLAK